ncbi:MAG: hypothetical protein EAX95_16650, partial [Candidatus Thorarchaeota archaeon]|nr:hypothetical protein [Candidatus Thorarchaeota archaeon]
GNNPLLEMRIHNIILSADLSRHDPNHPGQEQVYDGTSEGLATQQNKDEQEIYAQLIAENYAKGNWTGPWPVYHIYVLSATLSLLAHITVDILFSFGLVYVGFFSWFFDLLDLPIEEFAFWIDLLDMQTNWLVTMAAVAAFHAMTVAMMVFDYTKALPALAVGVSTWVTTAALCHVAAQFFATECENPTLAAFLWWTILIQCATNVVGAILLTQGLVDFYRPIAKGLFGFLGKHGVKVPWSGGRLKYAWATLSSTILLMGLCVYWIFQYASY